MRQCWLKNNKRAILFGLIPPTLFLLVGLMSVIMMPASGTLFLTLHWLGWGLTALSALVLVTLLMVMRLPRLAYQDGFLLVYLRNTEPIPVPIEVVECFFLGQAPRKAAARDDQSETSTIVIRLAESAEEWKQRDVKTALGQWCDGYITIRGTWCEQINKDLLKRLNALLLDARRQQAQVE